MPKQAFCSLDLPASGKKRLLPSRAHVTHLCASDQPAAATAGMCRFCAPNVADHISFSM